MQKVKNGDYVKITYEGALENGEIIDTSTEESPFEFTVGQKSVFPSFESGVIGMQPGETKSVKVSSEEAYGPRIEELIQTFDRGVFGDKLDPKPGMVVGMTVEKEGKSHQVPATILEINGDKVIIDYNHPLAGQDLLYKITIHSIVEAETQDNTAGCSCNSGACGCN